eukprot:1160304-Pelagomonas_calceolata.AAC.8
MDIMSAYKHVHKTSPLMIFQTNLDAPSEIRALQRLWCLEASYLPAHARGGRGAHLCMHIDGLQCKAVPSA